MLTTTTRPLRTTSVLLLTYLLCVSVAPAQAQTLDEIIDGSLAAAGGREAMGRVTSVRQVGTFTMSTDFGDIEGDTEIVVIPNQKRYQDLESDLFQQTAAWDGTSAWQSDSMQGMMSLEGQQAETLAAQTLLHPFLAYDTPVLGPAEYSKLDDAEIDGRPHHVIQVSTGSLTAEIAVDAETMLVSRTRIDTDVPQVGSVTITAAVSDYEEHDGLMFATRSLVYVPGLATIDTRIAATELNVEVDHSIFEKP